MSKLLKKDWMKDVVYLVQIPRAGAVPSISPFCLKLETWLRMAKVPYENINNGFKHNSSRGQIPFVEFNSQQIPDSNLIIGELTQKNNIQLDSHLSEKQYADMQAYHSLVEDTLNWQRLYFRGLDNSSMLSNDGIGAHFSGFKRFMAKNIVFPRRKKKIWNKCLAQGVAKEPVHEVLEKTKKNLKALSVFLGSKKFMFGDQPSTLDATSFGHLCLFYYFPHNLEIKKFMETDTPNILEYLKRVKGQFWPDWNEATSKLSLHIVPKIS